jgi:hypothetical protein
MYFGRFVDVGFFSNLTTTGDFNLNAIALIVENWSTYRRTRLFIKSSPKE